MTDQRVPISTLPIGIALTGAELVPVVQSGITIQTTVSAIKTFFGSIITGPASSTDKAIVRWNGTTGKIIQDYTSNPPTITDTGQAFFGPAGIPSMGTAFNTYATDLNSNVIINSFQASGSINAAGTVQALNFTVSDTGTNSITALAGITGTATKSGSGTATSLIGVSGGCRIQGTTIATSMTAFTAALRLQAGTSATNAIAFNAPSPTVLSTATVASCYGVRVSGQKITNVTTGYGIGCDGTTDLNYFMGNVGIGTSGPVVALDVIGFVQINGLPNIQVVAAVSGINAVAPVNTLAYTNATGKTLIVTGATVRCTAATAITNGPTVAIGTTAGASDVFAGVNLVALTTTSKMFGFGPVGMSVVIPNAGTVYFNITAGSTGTSQTIAGEITGYFI